MRPIEAAQIQLCEPANRDVQIDNLKREIEVLRVELERIKTEVRMGRESPPHPPQGACVCVCAQ